MWILFGDKWLSGLMHMKTFLVTKCYLIEMLLQFLICVVNAELFETIEIMMCQSFKEKTLWIVDTRLNCSEGYLFALKLSKP